MEPPTSRQQLLEQKKRLEEFSQSISECNTVMSEMDFDGDYFDFVFNAIKKYKNYYILSVKNVEFEFLCRYCQLIFDVIDAPKDYDPQRTKERIPVFEMLEENHLNKKYITYIICHKDGKYTIHVPKLPREKAKKLFYIVCQ